MQRTVKWPHALAVGLTKIHSTSYFLCFKKIELAQSHHYEQTDSMDKKIIRDLFQNLFTVQSRQIASNSLFCSSNIISWKTTTKATIIMTLGTRRHFFTKTKIQRSFCFDRIHFHVTLSLNPSNNLSPNYWTQVLFQTLGKRAQQHRGFEPMSIVKPSFPGKIRTLSTNPGQFPLKSAS